MLAIVVGELVCLAVVHFLDLSSPTVEMVIDATLLPVFLAPFVYLFYLRPLKAALAREGARNVALENSNRFIHQIVQSIPNPFYVVDAHDYRVRLANPAVQTSNYFAGITCHALTHRSAEPCASPEHVCPLQEVKKTKQPTIVEHIHFDDQGRPRYFEVHGYPIFDGDGQVAQMIEYSLDITDRRLEKDALRFIAERAGSAGSDDFFVAMVQNLTTVLHARVGLISTFSDATPGQVRTLAVTVDGERIDNFSCSLDGTPCAAVFAQREICSFPQGLQNLFPEDKVLSRFGAESFMGIPLLASTGEIIGHLAIIDDRPLENEALNRTILRIFAGRAGAELERWQAEDRLKLAVEKLQKSNRELQEFAYIASHDLQEPLRKVVAFGERLQAKCGDTLGEQGGDYLLRMQNSARRMQSLINGLLDYARVTTKAQPFAPVDLGRVIHEVVGDLEISLERSGGRVQVGPLPVIEADAQQFRQLIQNLLGNAIKYHREGVPPEIFVESRLLREGKEGQGRPMCRLTIQDNGIGFEDKYRERIFGVFQRLHGRGEYEGSGIGLAICRKIVERHGGTIDVESVLGEGTTFVVELPLHQGKGGDV